MTTMSSPGQTSESTQALVVPLAAARDGLVPDREQFGGKALHLMRLVREGFDVPPGFTITVAAYHRFVAAHDLQRRIEKIASDFAYDAPERLEQQAAEIREMILAPAFPEDLRAEILDAYPGLGRGLVAVRSSGTAEDMADASFAGQHDTYLDITGDDALLEAVQRCWASMWTTRAVAYRRESDIPVADLGLAVVVQRMVDAEVAGVMFTANPVTGATDEVVINASWGLGEAVVSGLVTPDQATVKKKSLRIKHRELGSKEHQVVRDPKTGVGTVHVETEPGKRNAWALSEEQIRELTRLGIRIEKRSERMPQDIEWALQDGRFYVLQARDITGVELTWDEDLEQWQDLPDDPDVVWSRGFADEYWTGAVTPLFYSWYAASMTDAHVRVVKEWGYREFANVPRHRYHRGEVYINSEYQKKQVLYTTPPQFRAPMVTYLPQQDQKEAVEAPLNLVKYLKMLARIELITDEGMFKWIDNGDAVTVKDMPFGKALTKEDWAALSGHELKRAIAKYREFASDLHQQHWSGFFIHAPNAITGLSLMLDKWYDGDNPTIFVDLVSGLPERTVTMEENHTLWRIAEEIRKSPVLTDLFHSSREDEFFARAAEIPEGAAVTELYDELVAEHGHRGHADRDIWFPRRADDPSIDYRSVKSLLTSDGSRDPEESERRLAEAREKATKDVIDRLSQQKFGTLKVAAFKKVLAYVHKFLVYRDNQRHFIDRVTYSVRLGFQELGARLRTRGRLKGELDHFFLSEQELFDLLDGDYSPRLIEAKIAGRRAAFDRFDRREINPPYFLKDGEPWVDPDAPEAVAPDDSDGVLQGFGSSRGVATGTARVIRDLKEIDRVQEGDILVTNSTDPAWTPVFMVIKGLVLATGGMLAHGACLSREYNLPAVTVHGALQRIPDGATISVDGTTGVVKILEPTAVAS
ncbi:phosphoenolpyruvate synthase [Pseudonocardia thermophila]|uniref:Phosphoenolpyruvate synthase n=1 Tax=Pseudonocardia thermophila TaxID=1848 RepID=A0A1M6WQ79_PSETH|nr:PEP/pyruvate-binding domain-containing protein [Pseudonocardia thermophila]SHK95920.1 phosphoenolpyruvate synthase [Pseudonocardia thermophila]